MIEYGNLSKTADGGPRDEADARAYKAKLIAAYERRKLHPSVTTRTVQTVEVPNVDGEPRRARYEDVVEGRVQAAEALGVSTDDVDLRWLATSTAGTRFLAYAGDRAVEIFADGR